MDAASDAGTLCSADAGMVLEGSGCVAVPAPRLQAPLSTSKVTSHHPTLHWLLAPGTDGAHIELCATRQCSTLTAEFDVDGASGAVPLELTAGVHFWRAFGRRDGVTGRSPSATWQFWVGHRSAPVDTSWGTTFDANGDGYADVIIGAPDVGNGNNMPPGLGHAYVFMGSAAGLSNVAATTLSGPSAGSLFGIVSSAGDINGDGFADAIVGAAGSDGYRGSAFVYLGGENGLSSSPVATLTAPSGGSFGDAVSSAGDINGDGYADVIVGAPNVSQPGVAVQFTGRAYVYFGGANGLDTSNPVTLSGSTSFGERFGAVVASGGDVDGDGRADLVVTTDAAFPVPGRQSMFFGGGAYVYLGSAIPFGVTAASSLVAPSGQEPVSVASAFDVNADGYADLVLGALGGATEVLGGAQGFGPNGSLSATFTPEPNTTLAYSYRVAAGGDINGDGYDDVVASYDSIYMYFGGAAGASDPPVIFTPPGQSASIYGYDITRAGDINGDGFDDLVIGAKFDNQFTGRAYVYFGSANGLSPAPVLVLPGPDGIGGEFG